MNDTGNVTQNRQENVDQEISTTSALEEDTERRKDDSKNDLFDECQYGPSTIGL